VHKNHEARFISWAGRASLSFPQEPGDFDVGAPGGAPDGPASKLRNADCGMRIEKENPKNPKSEIRNPK
jgi:hypothetical protein